jgi:hypothetical protein
MIRDTYRFVAFARLACPAMAAEAFLLDQKVTKNQVST